MNTVYILNLSSIFHLIGVTKCCVYTENRFIDLYILDHLEFIYFGKTN